MRYHYTMDRVVVFDETMYDGNGVVREWMIEVGRYMGAMSRRAVRSRTGELRSGIHGDVTRVGARQLLYRLRSEAPHTWYVLRGTSGPIMSDRRWSMGGLNPYRLRRGERGGMFLKLRAGGGYASFITPEVSGQRRNNFLLKGWNATSRRHRAIPPAPPSLRNP